MLVISGGEDLLLNVLSGKGHHDWMLITSSNADSHLNVLVQKGHHTWMLVITGGGNSCLNVFTIHALTETKVIFPVWPLWPWAFLYSFLKYFNKVLLFLCNKPKGTTFLLQDMQETLWNSSPRTAHTYFKKWNVLLGYTNSLWSDPLAHNQLSAKRPPGMVTVLHLHLGSARQSLILLGMHSNLS